jgi:hypothetical protein
MRQVLLLGIDINSFSIFMEEFFGNNIIIEL